MIIKKSKYERNRGNTGSGGLSNSTRLTVVSFIEAVCLVLIFFFSTFVTNVLGLIIYVADSKVSATISKQRFVELVGIYNNNPNAVKNWLSLITNYKMAIKNHFVIFIVIFLILTVLITILLGRIYYRNRNANQNQYGHAQLASRKDIKKQYPAVPQEGTYYKGLGGIPVATGKDVYYVDTDTTNNLVIGKTRSGKGESIIFPMIDILSRSSQKPAMIINDPKQELYRSSYITLRKRGFDVHVLNLKDPTNSIGYNNLQHVIDLAKLGYYDEVQQEVNKITTSIYDDPHAKDKFWNNSSINLMNSLILALLDKAKETNDYSFINMYTAVDMLTRMGGKTENITDDSGKIIRSANRLILYFESLAEQPPTLLKTMAINAFQQSKFAGDETAGNIYSSAMEKVKIYQQMNIAKLTGKSTLDLESIGFLKVFKIQLSESSYKHLNATVSFFTKDKNLIEEKTIEVDQVGVVSVPIKNNLPDNFYITVDFKKSGSGFAVADEINIKANKIFKRESGKFSKNAYIYDEFTKKPILEGIQLKIKQSSHYEGKINFLHIRYSEKPVVVFLATPIDNPAYNQIASFFIDQVFNVGNKLAITAGGKTYTRIHFIIDEFANLPAVPEIDKKVTLSLGMNMIWTLIVQNLEQLQINYSQMQANTIKDNCGNKIYLLSDSLKTVKEFKEYLGKQTVEVSNVQTNNSKINSSNSRSLIGQYILDENDLLQLQQGESVIVRSSKRTNLRGHKIMPYPIFNQGKYAFPFRYQLKEMREAFNTESPMSNINVISDVDRVEINLEDITIQNWDKEFLGELQKSEDVNNKNELSSDIDTKVENFENQEGEESDSKFKNTGYFLNSEQLDSLTKSKNYSKELLVKAVEEVFKQIVLDEGTKEPFGISEQDFYAFERDLKKDFNHINLDVFSYEIGEQRVLIEEIKNRLFGILKNLLKENVKGGE